MNKESYMRELEESMKEFDRELQQEILEDYEGHFMEGAKLGKSEEEICQELGNIQDMAAELFNTVAEELCDMTAASFNPVVRIVKDMAAGAVLVCAVFAAAVGICVFWQPAVFLKILQYFTAKPLMLFGLAVSLAVSIVFIILGPIGIRDHIRRKREE